MRGSCKSCDWRGRGLSCGCRRPCWLGVVAASPGTRRWAVCRRGRLRFGADGGARSGRLTRWGATERGNGRRCRPRQRRVAGLFRRTRKNIPIWLLQRQHKQQSQEFMQKSKHDKTGLRRTSATFLFTSDIT